MFPKGSLKTTSELLSLPGKTNCFKGRQSILPGTLDSLSKLACKITGAPPPDNKFQDCLFLQNTSTFTKQTVMVMGKMLVCYVRAVSALLRKHDAGVHTNISSNPRRATEQ